MQVQRRADSRALILDAAVQCLVEDGYRSTTTVAIQARAGVSRERLLPLRPRARGYGRPRR
jgi:AcrR family transcriptional regulator